MRKYKYETIVFVVEAIFMTVELVASRVLAPYFGNTNIVWTSIIGIILLSSSLGNFIGGILADKWESDKCLKILLIIDSIFILIIPFIADYILEKYSLMINDIKVAAIISTITLFFIPSLLLGFTNPIILKNKLNSINNAGKISGKIYAISTIGGIFGTFLSGFYLMPNFGSMEIIFFSSICLLLLSLFLHTSFSLHIKIIYIALIIIEILLSLNYYKKNIINMQKILNGDTQIKAILDTQYGEVTLSNSYSMNNKIRTLNIDGGYESATYLDKDKRTDLVYKYTKYYDMLFNSKIEINNVLMIGGGGYSYPKYFISHYLNKKIDVVEIDEDITRIAKKYFYLSETIDKYDAKKRIKIYNEDGRTYLNRNTKKYDAILNDAFSGIVPPKTLTTKEAISKIKSSLNKNGIYLTNVIGSIEGKNSKFLKSEIKTLYTAFKNVYIIPCNSIYKDENQNLMVIATDDDLNYENSYNTTITDEDIILTDNYCPVDSLVTQI